MFQKYHVQSDYSKSKYMLTCVSVEHFFFIVYI